MREIRSIRFLAACLVMGCCAPLHAGAPKVWKDLEPLPAAFAGATFNGQTVVLRSGQWNGAESKSGRWAYLVAPDEQADFTAAVTVTLRQPARQFSFFGQSWSVWPDPTWGDQGFEAAFLVRAAEREAWPKETGYRVQLSHKYQQVALVKFPDGGYLRSVPCEVKLDHPHRLEVVAHGTQIVVRMDGQEKIRYSDELLPLTKGRLGVGVSSLAEVEFAALTVGPPPSAPAVTEKRLHMPNFAARKWLGEKLWVFDGDEPVLLLPVQERKSETYFTQAINNVKLRPGYRPQLMWNGHWDLAGQGAFPAGGSRSTEPVVSGGGRTLTAGWSARHHRDRFTTQTTLTVGYDPDRGSYRYDVESDLEILPGEPFHIQSFDFEHHTPLDPFNWQYLVVRREGGALNHRPVYPTDPGVMTNVEQYHGLRMWYGRHNEEMLVAPAVEYQIDPQWNRKPGDPDQRKPRKLNTAVCAAFYDTGVAFEPETLPPGSRVRVKYRYTGYPADEARTLFEESTLYKTPTLDPNQHWIFADEWPKLTFGKFKALSEPWWNERLPFLSGHNQRPTYELARNIGVGSGQAIRLGPNSYAKAALPIPAPLAKGRYLVQGLCRSENTHGPGGRIELLATESETGRELLNVTHHVGNGSFDWRTVGFVFELPGESGTLSIAFGNAGTGKVLFTDVEFQRLEEGMPLPEGVLQAARTDPSPTDAAPRGSLADYRMQEKSGLHVDDSARGPFGLLELANLGWTLDEGRPALRFADRADARPEFPPAGTIERGYFSHPSYADRQTVPVAIAGFHGGGIEVSGLTVAAWIKPAERMGSGGHGVRGDIVGVGARRFILSLYGHEAPYRLGASLNVNDRFVAADTLLPADRWHHVAMTCEPQSGQWQVRLYLDGQMVHEGLSETFAAPATIPPSVVLGAELFYLHDAYYRGLIGRTLVLSKPLSAAEIADLAKP